MIIFLLFFLAFPCFGVGPKYQYKDPKLDDEINTIYKYLNGKNVPTFFTKAQLKALTPERAGLQFFCSDCTVDGIVQSTAATPGGVSNMSSRTLVIQ